jgi:adenylate cyclase
MSGIPLSKLSRCFQGLIPCALATSADGVPNITYLSQLLYVDEQHVGLSRQFFNKTSRNLEQNPFACIQVHDALTYEAYRLHVRYLRSETTGPLFEEQAARLEAIASHTGMNGVFRLQAVDICEVLHVEKVEAFLDEAPDGAAPLSVEFGRGPLTELRALQLVSDTINRASELGELLTDALLAFDERLGLRHAMLLLFEETEQRLVAIASRGYGESGVGAEVRLGEGLVGLAGAQRRLVRVAGLRNELRYSLAARQRLRESGTESRAEVALPGLPNAESQLALPLLVGGELVGVLAFESSSGAAFEAWHEAFLQMLSNHLASGIVRLRDDSEAAAPPPPVAAPAVTDEPRQKRQFEFFRNDDCIFVDGEYLVRNVPGRILWKLLNQYANQGRRDFNNRELRLDPTLGLPAVRSNLESRLVLLRKRLAEKCPDLRLIPSERGRFRLEVDCELSLTEREHA